jgi:probable O-glycosylation ligase (exosortase A-associated)
VRDLILAGLFICMAVFALQQAYLGVMLWVWSSLLPPNEYLFGFAQNIPFNKISVGCAVIGFFLDKRKKLSLDPLTLYLLIFLIEVSLAYAIAATPAGWGEELYQRFAKVVVVVFFIRFIVVDRFRLHCVLLAICLAVGTGATDEGLKFLLSGGGHHSKGPASWVDENGTATIILMAMPILLYVQRHAANKIFRRGCLLVFCMCAISVVGSYSRGGFVGLAILVLTLLTSARHRVRTFTMIAIMVAVGYFAAPASWFERIQTTASADQDSSFMGRVVQWKILTLMALDHPFFGSGILANVYLPTWTAYAARLDSELTFIPTPPPTKPFASHSIYFQVLGENGFIGLVLFLTVFWYGFRVARTVGLQARVDPNLIWAADLAKSLRLSLFLYLFTGAALPIPYFEFPYIILGCLSALSMIVKSQVKVSTVPTDELITSTKKAKQIVLMRAKRH